MFYYAQINEEGLCIGVSGLASKVEHEMMIPIDYYDNDLLWRKYKNGRWSLEKFIPLPPEPKPNEIEELKAKVAYLEEYSSEHEAALVDLALLVSEVLGDGN